MTCHQMRGQEEASYGKEGRRGTGKALLAGRRGVVPAACTRAAARDGARCWAWPWVASATPWGGEGSPLLTGANAHT